MRAATIPAYNAPYQIRDIKSALSRKLGADELRLKMLFASFNPFDWKARLGFTQKLFPMQQIREDQEKEFGTTTAGTSSAQQRESQTSFMIGGSDFCGEIIELGSNVSGFALGDIVCGAHMFHRNFVGTFAEEAIVYANEAARVPKGFPLDLAGSVGVSLLTAYQCLEKLYTGSGKFNRSALQGKSCMIIGAAGGVGSFATLLAKHYFGMRVYAVAEEKNHQYLMNLGADEAIDYHKVMLSKHFEQKPQHELNNLCGIIDVVGLEDYRKCAVKILGKTGAYVTTVIPETESGIDWSKGFEFVAQQFWKNTLNKLGASCSMHVVMERRDPKTLEHLLQFLFDNNLYDKVDCRVLPLDQIQQVDAESEKGHVKGKLVLQIANDLGKYKDFGSQREMGSGLSSGLGSSLSGGGFGQQGSGSMGSSGFSSSTGHRM